MGSHNKSASIPEQDLLKIANFVCNYAPGQILLIGGGCVLHETAGYPRMRNTSDDLDFSASTEGIAAIEQPLCLNRTYRDGTMTAGARVAYVDDILLGFFHKEIRGWEIPSNIFKHPRVQRASAGDIYMIPAELNVALKIRRGASRLENPHIYGKDALDFASIHSGIYASGGVFDSEIFAAHMSHGVCRSCNLLSNRACIQCVKKAEAQLPASARKAYAQTLEKCASLLEHCCI